MSKTIKTISWIVRIIAAIIMLQTLFFKFSAAPESVYIFTKLGMEPVGRIGTGIGELISSILLLIPFTCWIGAAIGIGLMGGALFFHFTTLGFEVMDDSGLLFFYALTVFVCCMTVVFIYKKEWMSFLNKHILKINRNTAI